MKQSSQNPYANIASHPRAIEHVNPDGRKVYSFRATCCKCGKDFETLVDLIMYPHLATSMECGERKCGKAGR